MIELTIDSEFIIFILTKLTIVINEITIKKLVINLILFFLIIINSPH